MLSREDKKRSLRSRGGGLFAKIIFTRDHDRNFNFGTFIFISNFVRVKCGEARIEEHRAVAIAGRRLEREKMREKARRSGMRRWK